MRPPNQQQMQMQAGQMTRGQMPPGQPGQQQMQMQGGQMVRGQMPPGQPMMGQQPRQAMMQGQGQMMGPGPMRHMQPGQSPVHPGMSPGHSVNYGSPGQQPMTTGGPMRRPSGSNVA